MKILNLYAGIGGNRKYWEGDITAVEIDENIAKVYQKLYRDDAVIVGDSCRYLEDHFQKFDFIWSSPPCVSHGQYRHNIGVKAKGYKPLLPDMTLYSQIIFLDTYFSGDWVVENTRSYYKTLIEPAFKIQRHFFWSNHVIADQQFPSSHIGHKNKLTDFDNCEIVKQSKIKNKRQVLRNCLDSEIGKYIFDCIKGAGNENLFS